MGKDHIFGWQKWEPARQQFVDLHLIAPSRIHLLHRKMKPGMTVSKIWKQAIPCLDSDSAITIRRLIIGNLLLGFFVDLFVIVRFLSLHRMWFWFSSSLYDEGCLSSRNHFAKHLWHQLELQSKPDEQIKMVTLLKCFAILLNVRRIASSFWWSSRAMQSSIAFFPRSNSSLRSRKRIRCSVKFRNWSMAFLFTWLYKN